MPTNPLGSEVSRFISGRDRNFGGVVFQATKPPLDSELNLDFLINLEARAEEVRSRVPSGWLMDDLNPRYDFTTNPAYSNQFYFGKQTTGELRNIAWAIVNGWTIPVTGTRTGAPPLAANDVDTWNKIQLNPPSTSTGGNRCEFVFLEVWLQRIDVDPAPPGVAPGKPQRGFLYKFGNVESGFSNLPDDLIDPDINYETTKRVQVQYRIRVVPDVNLVQYPEGFDPTLVFAQGALSTPSAVPFVNMRNDLGDPGLWRSGNGDPATFGTVDGYVYAIPLCGVFRRNSAGFSDVGNLAGSFNRNSKALVRTDATTYSNGIVLPAPLTDTATSFSLSSITGTVLSTIINFGEAYFKIDDEIVRVTNIIQVTPTNFSIIIDRGQLGTINRSHLAGKAFNLYTVRPDGLFADQVTATDILDMRHSVADKFDYSSILKTNVVELLKGNLRSTWKRYGSTNSSGSVILYGDRITDSSAFVGGLTRLDAPDGNRQTWSDAVVTQRFNVPVKVPSNSSVLNDNLSAPVQVQPFTGVVRWTGTPPTHVPGNRLVGGVYPSWWNGDQIKVEIAAFQAGVPGSDASQIRFVLPTEVRDSVLVRFEGMTTDPNGGTPANPNTTSPSATNPALTVPVTGKKILRHGDGINVSLDLNGNLQIDFQSGVVDSQLQEFKDAIQTGTTVPFVERVVMHVEFTVIYGSGRGLSHKPDWIHTAQWRGSPTNTSKVLLRSGLPDKTKMIPTYVGDSPLVQTGNDRQYAKTSEIMFDQGSKTVHVAPYRLVTVPSLLARSGVELNWYGTGPFTYQGAMPTLSQDGSTVVHPVVDPLDLFYNGAETRYVEVPVDYMPKPGLHYVPIQPVSNTVFSSGINFLMMAAEGPVTNTSNFNKNLVSYPASSPGYYVVTPIVGEVYGTNSGALSVIGQKVSLPKLSAASGGPFRGIRFPPFLGPARITGVYVRNGSAVIPTSSPFDNNRVFIGGVGTDVNLLHDDFDGPTFLLDVDVNGDITFILNADALDLTKAPPGTTFDNTNFLVECVLFGFDRGFLQTNSRLLVAKSSGGGSTPITVNTSTSTDFTDSSDSRVGIIVPAPMSAGATNNEVTMYYSRSPYQGDPFGTQSAYSDDLYRLGPLTPGEATSIYSNPLGPVNTLTLPNKSGFEVLDAISFVTSLGTGRLSGSNPIPLLNTTEAPNNPPDYAGTRVDLQRTQSLNRVGFEDWAQTKWPVSPSSLSSRNPVKVNAISEFFDQDVHPELAGSVVQLPLGSYFRDKDFVGKTLYQARSASNNGSIPVGTTCFVPYQASMAKGTEGLSTWEGTEFVCGKASNTSGVGTEAMVRVDGTSNVSSVTVFKTTRGGASYSATGPWPGGIITSRFNKSRPNAEVGSVLMCTAYLVRSQPESNGGGEIHMGNELQMIIVTQAVPSYFRDSEIVHSASGANEGFTAVDRFRLLGKPLEKRNGQVNLNTLPADKPLFVNKIYDNPLFFGSSDFSLVSAKQETLPVTVANQTAFLLSERPLDPKTVQMFVNGVKLQYGVDFTVTGTENKNVTYIPNPPVHPNLAIGDIVEFWYLLFLSIG